MAGGVLFRVTFCAGDILTFSVLTDTQKRQNRIILGLFLKMLRKERIAVRGQILKEQPGGGAVTYGFGDRDKGKRKALCGQVCKKQRPSRVGVVVLLRILRSRGWILLLSLLFSG